MRPQSSMRFGETHFASSRIRTKLRFMFLVRWKVSRRLSTSMRPEEREFVVDSGASMHMTSEKDLSSGELDTLRRSQKKRDDSRDANDPLRSSQIIWRTLNCMRPHTFLRTQIRNVLWKWYQNQGSTVSILTSQKTEIAKSACEPTWQGLLAEDALAKLYLEQRRMVTWYCWSQGP